MISICIPIYNFDCTPLIQALEEQILQCGSAIKIIAIDDGSDKAFEEINKKILLKHNYIVLPKNIGRAKIRNLFLKHTDDKYLLYLDCDVIVPSHFLKQYVSFIEQNNPKVICGGRVYPKLLPEKNRRLSYLYGKKRESKVALERNKAPNNAFMTNNFIIQRSILKEHPFDEKLSEYGHEDTLLGFELKKAGVPISHIENAVINGDIETNAEYLKKSVTAIENLVLILENESKKDQFIASVRLLDVYYNRLNSLARWAVKFFFLVTKRPLSKLLINGNISLTLFDFYKLGVLSEKV